jgi:hypothetical protein
MTYTVEYNDHELVMVFALALGCVGCGKDTVLTDEDLTKEQQARLIKYIMEELLTKEVQSNA